MVSAKQKLADDPAEVQVRALTKIISPAIKQATTVTVETAYDFETAALVLKDVKARATEVDNLRKSLTKPLDESKKRIMDLFRPIEAQLKAAEAALKGAMLDFQNAERRRLAIDAAVAEEARQAELDRLAKLEEKARSTGKVAKAEALAVIAAATPAVEVEAPTQVAGIQTRTTWHAEVEDMDAFMAWVASGRHYLYVNPNQTALDRVARFEKGEASIPGVRMVSTEHMAAGR